MSWRAGGKLFWDIWPQVREALPDREGRMDFARPLIELFLNNDVDPCEMRGGDPEVDELMDELDREV
jgi:hypothetical protein